MDRFWINRKKDHLIILILIAFSSLLAIDLFLHPGVFTAHDIEANIGRFGAYYLGVSEGHLFPTWAADVANGYGSPVVIFSYLTPYILQLPIKLLSFSLVDTAKIYILFGFISASVLFYAWLRHHMSALPSFIGAFLFAFAPYRINDIYARGSISEHTAFILIPLVGLLLYKLRQKPSVRLCIGFAFALCAFVLSHPFFSIICAPFFILYWVSLLGATGRAKFIFQSVFAAVIAVLLSSFFLFPLTFENKYLHYNINPFSTTWSTQFIDLHKLITPQWTFIDSTGKLEYQTWQIGLVHIVLIIAATLFAVLFRKRITKLYVISLLCTFLSIFLMTNWSEKIYQILPLLQHIQFPWRFAGLTVTASAILAACLINEMVRLKKSFSLVAGICAAVLVGCALLYLPYAKGHGYKNVSDHYYLYELVTNTEGVATTPVWASTPDQYPRAQKEARIVDGAGEIENYAKTTTKRSYTVHASSQVRVVEDVFYFPNWQVSSDGEKIPVQFQDPDYRGLITYTLAPGNHSVSVEFLDTKLRTMGKLVTMITLLVSIILIVADYFKILPRFRKSKTATA